MGIAKRQRQFLKLVDVCDDSKALANTVKATFQRNNIYKKQLLPRQRRELRTILKCRLQEISVGYSKRVSETKHCENIEELARTVTKRFKGILHNEKFTIGSAQKALNLYLKFKWCMGKQRTPAPHCPLDRKVLNMAGIDGSWTKLDSIKKYKDWVSILKSKAKANKQSLPMWELCAWKR